MIVALLPEFEENKTTEHRFFCQGSPVYIKWKQGFAFLESVFPLILPVFYWSCQNFHYENNVQFYFWLPITRFVNFIYLNMWDE
jgi:hypothetical protein